MRTHRLRSRTSLTSFLASGVTALALITTGCGGAPKHPVAVVPPPTTGTPVAVAPPAPTPTPAPAPVHATKVREVEGITEYALPNGLKVLLFPDPTQSTVTVNITYLVGSRQEGYGETGMAHLLEHMSFKGTPTHHNILKLVDARGGQANGSTWNDRTNYFETLAATDENLQWALELEADRMVNCSIAAEELATEFSVVRNEFEMGENNATQVLEQRMVATAYLWHNYGKDTIGSRADIERVPADALRAFYKKYYQPDDAVLVVAGKFDPDAALAKVEATFGAIPKPERVLPPTYTVEPVQDGERSVTLRRNGDVYVVGALYHTVAGASPDYAAVSAALDLLTREPSGRLYKSLVATKLATSIESHDQQFKDPGAAVIIAEVPNAKNADKVRDQIFAAAEGLGTSKIDDADVERWRAAELKNFDLVFANSQWLAIGLSEYAALGDWRTLFSYRDQVKAVTAADVARVAKLYFKASNRTAGEFIPTKDPDRAPLTETPDVAKIVDKIDGGDAIEQGEAFAATVDNIESRVTRVKLKGGLDAAFLPKKTRAGKVQVQIQLQYGDEKSLADKVAIADLATQMLARGTTKHTFQQIQDLKDQLKARIGIYGGAGNLVVNIDTMRDQLPAALDLMGEMLTSPSFPASELELIRQEQLTSFAQEQTDPSQLAWIELGKASSPWPKGDPRYTMSPQEKIDAYKKVTIADIKAFYRDLLGANHGQVAVIGSFDPATVQAQLEKLLGGWASKKPYARLVNKNFAVAGAAKQVDTKDKEMAQISMSVDVDLKDDSPDYAAWLMVGQILGGDTGSRIWMRVREKEGLSYGAGAWTYASSLDNVGGAGGYAIVAPQNMDKALASILDEFAKMTSTTVGADELKRSQDAWVKSFETNLANDGYVAGQLVNGMYLGRTLAWQQDLRAKILAVTPDDVARVAKKYLHPDKLVVIEAGDLAKAKTKPAN